MAETPLDKSRASTAKTACGGKLKDVAGYPSTIYHGEQVYFCTRACLSVFEQNPDPFMAGEIEHPIHEEDENI